MQENGRAMKEEREGIVQGLAGTYAGQKIRLRHGETVWFGAGENNTFIIRDGSVAEKHCGISFDAENGCFWAVSMTVGGSMLGDGRILPQKREVQIPVGVTLKIKVTGKVLADILDSYVEKHPCVGEVRHIGLFSAIELVKDKKTREPLVPFGKDDIRDQGRAAC